MGLRKILTDKEPALHKVCKPVTAFDSKLHEPAPAMPSAFTLFADAVRDNTDFLVKPEEGVIVMRLLDAIYKSAATGKPVEL